MRHAILFLSSLLVSVTAAGAKPGAIVVHSAYGTATAITVSGRVMEAQASLAPDAARGGLANAMETLRAFDTDEIEGAVVQITVGATSTRATTDRDGCFEAQVALPGVGLRPGWQSLSVALVVDRGHPAATIESPLLIIDERGVAVVSDFDDTVVESHVTKKGELLVRTFTRNARQLEPVVGVGEAYRQMASAGAKAFFYVSGSPQNLHQRIIDYLEYQRLPTGVVLLKNFGQDGMTEQHAYKTRRIDALMRQFPQLQFVLVGDTGEQDPEIYRAVAAKWPGRVRAIVMRKALGGNDDPKRLEGMVVLNDYQGQAERLAALIQEPNAGVAK